MQHNVHKHVLDNGLTLLIAPQRTVPKVSMQMWYNVGAKDETDGQRGVAHYIEHMIFKGTALLSESDINSIVHKLSGSCNAFTSHDYTGYMFEMPSQHWYKVLPIMADCMRGCAFHQQQLSSELRAIIQEMRMYRDDYTTTALEQLTQHIFVDHPYHYPIIGYQDDLVHLDQDAIRSFYDAYYKPNNATLVIVGDTSVDDAIAYAEQAFGHIPRGHVSHQRDWSHTQDVRSYQVTLYREVQQPAVMLSWEVPGFQAQCNYLWDVISWILGSGRGSRLYKRLMTDEDLVTDLQSFVYDLFEYGQFVIYLQPRDLHDMSRIKRIIHEEIHACMQGDITEREIARAQRKTQMDFMSVFEDIERHAYLLGKFYLATGDEHALYAYAHASDSFAQDIQDAIEQYLKPSMMHTACVTPVPDEDKQYLHQMQHEIDARDEQALQACVRTSDVEPEHAAVDIDPEPIPDVTFPRPHTQSLSHGAKLLYHHRGDSDKVEIVIDLKAKHFYDPDDKQGRYLFMTELLQEGTHTYTAHELAQELEHYGMSLNTAPGSLHLTVLSGDIERGVSILNEILTQATFNEDAIERVRNRLLSDVQRFWDTPTQFSSQLLREAVYQDHPYHKSVLGTSETISQMTRDDLVQAYRQYVIPDQAVISVVGQIDGIDVPQLFEHTLSQWTGDKAQEISFSEVERPHARVMHSHINRDQTVLCFAGLSVSRSDDDFDPLLLFDQSFTGGVLDGMHSQLFALREQSGLFYAAGGSLLAGAGRGPGMILIKSIVSNDRLEEAQHAIANLIQESPNAYTEDEHTQSQQAIINTLFDNFATQQQTAQTFVALERFNFPFDHFDHRPQQIRNIDAETVRNTAARYLDVEHCIVLHVGRVS